jgi:hypothetical protein
MLEGEHNHHVEPIISLMVDSSPFCYCHQVPFALLSDPSIAIVHCIEIFVLTYGFMGLETVSIELDNPFGDDDNDFDNLGMAYVRTLCWFGAPPNLKGDLMLTLHELKQYTDCI